MYSINAKKMYYDMADGQAIVINFETGMYYGMSPLASAILDLILKGATPEAIAAALKGKPGASASIEEDIKAFIQKLMDREILVVQENQDDLKSIAAEEIQFDQEALAEGFGLEINEYAEAQDLILADPIHDVNVDMGWPIMKES